MKYDPTKSIGLRRKFQNDINRRFNLLVKLLRRLIVEEDAFALKPSNQRALNTVINTRWRGLTSAQKVTEFRKWLEAEMPTLKGQPEDAYFKRYVEEGYRKGTRRAYEQTAKTPAVSSPDFFKGTKEQFVRTQMGGPIGIEKVKFLVGRTFNELEGVTSEMSKKLTRELADGLVEGKSIREMASSMSKEIGISRRKALTIARTETTRAHAEGQLDSLEALGMDEIGVDVEWDTSGDPCPMCSPMDGVVLSVTKARGLLPRHPNCRCAYLPYVDPGRSKKEKNREIRKAVDSSIRAEFSKGSLKDKRSRSSWIGADTDLRRKGPAGIDVPPLKRTIERCGGLKGNVLTYNAPAPCDLSKSELAKVHKKRVAKEVQRYSEERNEKEIAKKLGRGAKSMDDNEPHDIYWKDKGKEHGIELKTMVDNSNNKLTMKKSARDRKRQWMNETGGTFHTLVLDDNRVIPGGTIDAKSKALGKLLESGDTTGFDFSKRKIFYRRGYGSFRVGGMHEVKSTAELKRLLRAEVDELPYEAGGPRPKKPKKKRSKKR